MQTRLRRIVGFGMVAIVAVVGVAGPAWSDDRKHDRNDRKHDRNDHRGNGHDRGRDLERRREAERRQWEWRRAADRHEWERRRDLERHRAAAFWRFERDRGWRWEHRPGVWSPFFVWWAIDGRPLLRPYPTVRIVRYPTGYYELLGDGVTRPLYWVWRPTVVASPPPIPVPPPFPTEYQIPAGAYPPPPPVPAG
jgi:hypothetical protein